MLPPSARQGWIALANPWNAWRGERAMLGAGCAIAGCMGLLAVLALVRAVWDGHLDPDRSNLPLLGYLLVVVPSGAAQLFAGWLFLKAWSGAGQLSWKRLGAMALAIHLCAAGALPLTSNDLFSNVANGRLLARGWNPYVDAPADLGQIDPFQLLVAQNWYRTSTPYGPVTTWASRLAVVSGDLWTSIWMFKLELLAVSLATLAIAYRFCRYSLSEEAGPRSFLFIAWNPLLAWELSSQVHNDVLLVAGCAAFVWAAARGKPLLAGAALVAAFYAKFAIAPVLGLYGIYLLRRSPARGLTLAAGAAAAGVLLFSPFWQGARTLEASLAAAQTTPEHLCHSLISVATRLVSYVDTRWAIDAVLFYSWPCKAGFTLLAGWVAWRARSLAAVFGGSMLFLFLYESLGMGWFFPWYVTWLFPLAMAQGHRSWQQIVGTYAALAPLVYIPWDGCLVGALLVQCVPLMMCLRAWRRGAFSDSPPLGQTESAPRLAELESGNRLAA